jgi:3-phenylpropionate/trans-cinnamate dioxygenase ferredoxin reductase subunit
MTTAFVLAEGGNMGAVQVGMLAARGGIHRSTGVHRRRDRTTLRTAPLSMGYLLGMEGKAKLYVQDEGWYLENSVELQLGSRVASLDRAGRRVELEGGNRLGYRKLLLATGAPPRGWIYPVPT